jgi:hypothetical protein
MYSDLVITSMKIELGKNFAPYNSSRSSSMTGIGYLSLMVRSFRA